MPSVRHHIVKGIYQEASAKRRLSDKIADTLTTRFGTMTFLLTNLTWFTAWIIINLGLIPKITPFDPFPFGLLTMIVSLEAILLSIVVLISQNRAAQIDNLREEVDLQVNILAEKETTKIIQLLALLLKKNGIDISKDRETREMLEPTDPEKIKKNVEKQIEQ